MNVQVLKNNISPQAIVTFYRIEWADEDISTNLSYQTELPPLVQIIAEPSNFQGVVTVKYDLVAKKIILEKLAGANTAHTTLVMLIYWQ